MRARALRPAAVLGTAPPVTLAFDMRDVYPADHWAIRGDAAGLRHARRGRLHRRAQRHPAVESGGLHRGRRARAPSRVLLGTLAGNPFPDATPEFFAAMARALSLGLAAPIDDRGAVRALRKADVIRTGIELGVPLRADAVVHAAPNGLHCGRCSKCRERRDAFAKPASPTRRTTSNAISSTWALRSRSSELSQLALSLIAPSPVRIRSILPPVPSLPRSVRRSLIRRSRSARS